MIGIDQAIVTLWFLPVVCFIILPLFITTLGLLYFMFDVFKSMIGKKSRVTESLSEPGIATAA